MHVTPRRVFGMMPGSGVKFCDYMFPDEDISDSLERFHTLFDLLITETDMITDIERLPGML